MSRTTKGNVLGPSKIRSDKGSSEASPDPHLARSVYEKDKEKEKKAVPEKKQRTKERD